MRRRRSTNNRTLKIHREVARLVAQYKWEPSFWFKARTRIAPPFPRSRVAEASVGISAELEPRTPSVDLIFPAPQVDELLTQICTASLSADLIECPAITTTSLDIYALLSSIQVSKDLFVPLGPGRNDGRKYDQRTRDTEDADQGTFSFASPSSQDKDGYRKGFTEIPDRASTSRRTMTIWDMILPLLEPPLSLDFLPFDYLPSPLRPYQVDGVRFLVQSQSALLGDDMGTGKTVQTIVALRILFQTGKVSSALILVPLTLLPNWDRELLKWAPTLTGVTFVRGSKQQRQVQWEKPAHIWVTTYGTVRSDIDDIVRLRHFDIVVIDEIQAIKNSDAAQTRAAKRIPRARAWGLSGTPIENTIDDLCSIFDFLKPGLLPRNGLTPEVAKRRITEHFKRRRKQDVLQDLPEKTTVEIWLEMQEAQRTAYEIAESEGRVWLEKLGTEVTVQHVLSLLQKLKMLCNRDPKSGESAKLDRLEEMLAEAVAEGSKALVFSQFLDEGVSLLADRLSIYKPSVITGEVTGRKRESAVHLFQTEDSCKLLIATPKSGGVGLNLVAGNYVFHFDHWWNPATARQAEDRAHRIGQTKDVFVYHLWTQGTVEQKIYDKLISKQQVYDDVIDALSNVESSGLSEDDLFDLFDLKSPKQCKHRTAAATIGDAPLATLLAMTPERFEQTIAQLYQALGFGARVTPHSRDGGVDVIASRSVAGGTEKFAIQCKRFDPSRSVGSPLARDLLGVLGRDRSFTKGVLITTSDFSAECREFANGQGNLELINGSRLVALIREVELALD